MSGWWIVLIVSVCVVAFVALSMFMDAVDHPARRCPHCDKKFGADHIPPEIRQAARAAGLRDPMWYVGRTYCPNYKRQKTLSDIVREVKETCPVCGGKDWRGAVDGPYGICMGCGYENVGDPPYA